MLLAATFISFGLVAAFAQTRFTRPPPTMLPQCQCSDLNDCMQREQQKLETCSTSPRCVALLGGNQAQVNTCLTQRFARMSNEETCLLNAIGLENMGCTNSTSPPQLPTYRHRMTASKEDEHYRDDETDTSALGQYYSCVQSCLNSTNTSSRKKRDATGFCPEQLNCSLDKAAMKSAGAAIWPAMLSCGSQDQDTDPDVSDCQCLANANVTIDCRPTEMFVVVIGRSRRAAYEEMVKA
uniref:Uncharacterized protein n=1 Tax=Plectus sambesii TaxID=2011161 RepID=A0A914WTX5_9BILA